MTITVTDPVLLAELKHLDGSVALTDPEGRLIGTLKIKRDGELPPGIKSTFVEPERSNEVNQK